MLLAAGGKCWTLNLPLLVLCCGVCVCVVVCVWCSRMQDIGLAVGANCGNAVGHQISFDAWNLFFGCHSFTVELSTGISCKLLHSQKFTHKYFCFIYIFHACKYRAALRCKMGLQIVQIWKICLLIFGCIFNTNMFVSWSPQRVIFNTVMGLRIVPNYF